MRITQLGFAHISFALCAQLNLNMRTTHIRLKRYGSKNVSSHPLIPGWAERRYEPI